MTTSMTFPTFGDKINLAVFAQWPSGPGKLGGVSQSLDIMYESGYKWMKIDEIN